MAVERQNSDGSMSLLRERDSVELTRVGGIATPAGGNVPSFIPGSSLTFNIGGGTDTGGGLLSWKNTLGYDILVTWHAINITTVATSACSASFGQTATNATTLASNMISAQDIHTSTGTTGTNAPLAILVPANTWITGSVSSGASAGMVGLAYFYFIPVKS